MRPRTFANLATAALTSLIFLCLAWELWLAPLRPGGSWLVLKVLPLLFPLRGILHGQRYTFQWSSMLILAYFAEGIVRVMTETGMSTILASVEICLSLMYFSAALTYARATMARKTAQKGQGTAINPISG